MAILGGAVVVVASFLTWVSVELSGQGLIRASGIDQVEGRLTLAAGVVVIAAAVVLLLGGRIGRVMLVVGVAAAMFTAVVMLLELVDVQHRIADGIASGTDVSFGPGLWVTGVGAIIALIGFGRSLTRPSGDSTT